MTTVYIGIGSNLGRRKKNCLMAVELLKGKGVRVAKESSLYETEPWGVKDQPAFINMVIEAQTDLSPEMLLSLVKDIEYEIGRSRTRRWGPRKIDLDILLYGDMVINTPDLVIPHPYMHERQFVMRPLSEIAPDLIHPIIKKKMRDILITLIQPLPDGAPSYYGGA